MKERIIITCKDPSSAYDLSQILKDKLFKKRFDIIIIAEKPAFNILKTNKIKFPIFNFKFEKSKILNKKKFLEIFLKFRPKKILTGISNNGYGIDEIAIFIGNKFRIKTYAIQSYWGDINNNLKSLPTAILVSDQLSKKITLEKNSKLKTHIVGSLKVDNLKNINVDCLKNRFRKKNKIKNDKKIIIFFGQPLIQFDWYFEIIASTIEKFQQMHCKNFIFFYKLHPKENNSKILKKMIRKYKKHLEIKLLHHKYPYIESLCGSDILISCCSTVNYEAQVLISKKKKMFTVPVYINPIKLIRWFKKEFGLKEIPYSKYLTIKITNDYNMIDFIKNKSYVKMIYLNIMKKIKIPNTNPIKNIITLLSR